MFIAYVVTAVMLSLVLLGSGTAKLRKDPRVVKSIHGEVGVPLEWFAFLAAAEVAGALGLITGIWIPALGFAAASGVVLYFLGAVGAHLRAHDRNVAPPVVLGVVAAVALLLVALRLG